MYSINILEEKYYRSNEAVKGIGNADGMYCNFRQSCQQRFPETVMFNEDSSRKEDLRYLTEKNSREGNFWVGRVPGMFVGQGGQ